MRHLLAIAVAGLLTIAAPVSAAAQSAPGTTDAAVKKRVEAVLLTASDLPGKQITVAVAGGVVTLGGQLSSDGMRGVTYPAATLQQSIGAVVRAVPGVKDVRFALRVDASKPVSSR